MMYPLGTSMIPHGLRPDSYGILDVCNVRVEDGELEIRVK